MASWAVDYDTALASESVTHIKIKAAKDLGVISPPRTVKGRDGGYSVWFNNHSVWIFGDTLFKANNNQSVDFQSNSYSWTSDRDASDGIGPFYQPYDTHNRPALLLPFTDAEKAFNVVHAKDDCTVAPCGTRWALWPGAIVADTINNRMLLFYEKLYIGPGELNYTISGYGIAPWNNFEAPSQRIELNPGHEYPTLIFGPDEPGFGDAAVIIDRMLYVYGCSLDGVRIPCRIARVDLDRVFDKKHWETWTDDGSWNTNLLKSKPVFNGNEILSVSYNPYIDRFIAVYSQPMSTSVMLRTAERPEGPWSDPVELFKALAPENKIGWIYDALEHAEYSQENGRILYITYSRQTAPTAFEFRLVSVQIESLADPD